MDFLSLIGTYLWDMIFIFKWLFNVFINCKPCYEWLVFAAQYSTIPSQSSFTFSKPEVVLTEANVPCRNRWINILLVQNACKELVIYGKQHQLKAAACSFFLLITASTLNVMLSLVSTMWHMASKRIHQGLLGMLSILLSSSSTGLCLRVI